MYLRISKCDALSTFLLKPMSVGSLLSFSLLYPNVVIRQSRPLAKQEASRFLF